jgi:hypothetical protein
MPWWVSIAHEAIRAAGGMHARIGRVRGQPGLVFVMGAADVNHPLDAGQLRFQLGHGTGELGADEQHPGLGVVDDVDDLGRRQAEVHHRIGSADLRAGQRQLQARRVVQVEHGDAVAGLQAGGAQSGDHALHPLGQLGPGAARVAEGDRRGIGPLAGPAGQHVAEIGMVWNHRVSSPLRFCAPRQARDAWIVARGRKTLSGEHSENSRCGFIAATLRSAQ